MNTLPSCSDYSTSIVVKELVKAPQLDGGSPEMHNGRPIKYTGGFCIVFPYQTPSKKYAVRCWHAHLEGAQERTKTISEKLSQLELPYFVEFEYVDNGIATPSGIQPVVLMEWVDAQPLKAYIKEHLSESTILKSLAENFKNMAKVLHENSISHGDLQHGNIMVKTNGDIVLVDYDSMYVPELEGWSDEIRGLQGYQHPARWKAKKLSPKADYFSELVIYTSILALAERPSFWQELDMENTDTLLFSADDIASPDTATIFCKLEKLSSTKRLSSKIKEFLRCTSIEELQPIEQAVESIGDILSKKWDDNGYTPQPPYGKEDVKKITNKF